MHVPDHADMLPEEVDPIPMPDTPQEAALLCLLLDLGVYPSCEALSDRIDSDKAREEDDPSDSVPEEDG